MLNPNTSPIDLEIANLQALLAAGRRADAEAAARSLQQRYPERGDANEALALTLVNIGKFGDAFKFAEAAVKAEPRNAGYLINLGRLYLRAELIEEAAPVLEKAFRINSSLYQAPWALGEFYIRTGSGGRAVGYLKQALRASTPQDKPEIELMLADCYSAIGENDDAERIYRSLLNDANRRQAALAHLAEVSNYKADSEICAELEKEIAAGSKRPGVAVNLRLALGRIYENSGRYEEAYEQFRLSKTLIDGKHDIERFKARVDRIIGMFTPAKVKEFEGYGNPSGVPVFVVGLPRSGTTLAEQIIAAHPKASGAGELNRVGWMNRAMNRGSDDSANLFDRMREGGPDRCRDLAAGYVNMLKFMAPGAKRVVDKMPHNFMQLGFICLFFPNARIVHCLRNPADNFVSAFQNNMNADHSYSYSPEAYSAYFKEYMRLMRHWYEVFPDRIFRLRYEDVTASAEKTARDLLEFIGLEWDPRCLEFHKSGSMVKTYSRQQVRNPVHRASVERWRNYEMRIRPLCEALRDEARDLGYVL